MRGKKVPRIMTIPMTLCVCMCVCVCVCVCVVCVCVRTCVCVCVCTYIPLVSEQVLSRLHRNCSRMYRVELSATVRFILFNPCTSSGTRPVGGDLQTDRQIAILDSISLSYTDNQCNIYEQNSPHNYKYFMVESKIVYRARPSRCERSTGERGQSGSGEYVAGRGSSRCY